MKYDKVHGKIIKLSRDLEILKEKSEKLMSENEKYKSAITGIMHETRRFSSELSSCAAEISKLAISESKPIKEISDTISNTSELLASRLAFADIELNPEAIRRQYKVSTGIYKKFDKANYTLKNKSNSKQCKIKLVGKSSREFDAIEAFQLVPFVILDNAIKYSPPNQDITVTFTEHPREVEVTISSYGPIVGHDEFNDIFKEGFRGRNGVIAKIPGEGLGLYLAYKLCELTAIKITASSNQHPEFSLGNVDYSVFTIKLLKKF